MPKPQTFTITPPMTSERAREIATSFDLRKLPPDFYSNPYPVYAELRASEPVKQLPDGVFFLTRYADLVSVYRDSQNFSSDKRVEFFPKFNTPPYDAANPAPLYQHHTHSLVFSDPPIHTRVRKLMMGALTRRAIAEMEDGLVQLVNRLLDQLEAQGGGDLIADYASAIPVEIIGNLLDIPHDERGPLRDWSLAILGALEPSLMPEQIERGNRSVSEFMAYLKELVAERRRHPGNPEHDVLTRLIQGEKDAADGPGEQLNEQELLQNCIFILNAGHETTTNLIGNALVALYEYPIERAGLYARMQDLKHDSAALETCLDGVVDEFLRFESSNQLGNRRALKACTVGGVTLPQGALITLCIGAANRDPAQFEDVDKLDLYRPNNRHLSFGFGMHQCAGLSLARLEGRVAIGHFLQRFPNFRLTEPPLRGGRARFRGFLKAPFSIR
jgi:cytochrome P450